MSAYAICSTIDGKIESIVAVCLSETEGVETIRRFWNELDEDDEMRGLGYKMVETTLVQHSNKNFDHG
jgi:hypothetical protein